MRTLAQFGEIQFGISTETALLFEKLKISAECETDDKKENSQGYVKAKNGKPAEISMSVALSAALGVDVQKSAMQFLNAAQRSTEDYLYVGGKKVFPFKLMMTKADTEEILLSPKGVWTYTKISITLKQSSKEWILEPEKEEPKPSHHHHDDGGGGGSYAPQKASVKTTTPQKKTPQDLIWERGSGYQGAVGKATKTTQTAKKKTSTVTKKSSGLPSR